MTCSNVSINIFLILLLTIGVKSSDKDDKCATTEVLIIDKGAAPGRLYNAQSEKFLDGLSLWNQSQIEFKELVLSAKKWDEVKMGIANTTSERAALYGVSLETALRILFQNEEAGSVTYFKDVQKTETEETFTIVYKTITHSYSIPSELLHKKAVVYPDLLKGDRLTHVVTKVNYGGNFVFNCRHPKHLALAKDNSSAKDYSLAEVLDAAIKANQKKEENFFDRDDLKAFNITDGEAIEMKKDGDTVKAKRWAKTLECDLHADVSLKMKPRNAYAVVDTLTTISTQISNKTVMDITATIFPVQCIAEKGDGRYKIRNLNKTLLASVMKHIDDFEIMMRKVEDTKLLKLAKMFPGIHEMIEKFLDHCTVYQDHFMTELKALFEEWRHAEKKELERAEANIHILLKEYPNIGNLHVFQFAESRQTEDEILSKYPFIEEYLKTDEDLMKMQIEFNTSACPMHILGVDLRVVPECDEDCSYNEHFNKKKCSDCLEDMGNTWSKTQFKKTLEVSFESFITGLIVDYEKDIRGKLKDAEKAAAENREPEKDGNEGKDRDKSCFMKILVIERLEADKKDAPKITVPSILDKITKNKKKG